VLKRSLFTTFAPSRWFSSQIVIAAFGSVQFVSNVFCAKLFFGVPATSTVMLSTLLIVGGNILIIIPPYVIHSAGNAEGSQKGTPGAEELFVRSGCQHAP
jgi:hypothetical protein